MNNSNPTRRQPKTWRDISPKKTYRKQISTGKDAQYHWVTRETQTKTIMRYQYTQWQHQMLARMRKKLDYLHIAGGNVKWHRHSEKETELSLKTKHESKTNMS